MEEIIFGFHFYSLHTAVGEQRKYFESLISCEKIEIKKIFAIGNKRKSVEENKEKLFLRNFSTQCDVEFCFLIRKFDYFSIK